MGTGVCWTWAADPEFIPTAWPGAITICAPRRGKPPVDAVARRAIERRGLAERVSVVSGETCVHAQLPQGHDVHLYSNVIHDWDEAEVRQIFSASFGSRCPTAGS